MTSFLVVNAGFFVLSAYLLFVRKGIAPLLYLFAISLAFSGVVTFAGTVWNPTKIVGLFCVAAIAITHTRPHIFRSLVILLLVSLLISVVAAFIFAPSGSNLTGGSGGYSLRSTSLRPIVQAYRYICGVAVFSLLLSSVLSRNDIQKILAIVFWATCFSAFIGLVHFACIKLGLPFLPIPRFGGEASEMAAFGSREGLVGRVYGLAGEPKHLASFLVPGFFVQCYYYLQRGGQWVPTGAALVGCCVTLVILLLTYSTSAYVALLAGFPAFLYFAGHGAPGQLERLIRVFAAFVVLFVTAALIGAEDIRYFTRNFEQRFSRRLEHEIEDRLEVRAVKYMALKRPETVLFGLGPGMYSFHGIGAISSSRGAQPMTSMWVTIFSDLGLFGLGIVLVLIVRVIREGTWIQRALPTGFSGACFGGLIGCVFTGIAIGDFSTMLFFAGLVAACGIIPESTPNPQELVLRH